MTGVLDLTSKLGLVRRAAGLLAAISSLGAAVTLAGCAAAATVNPADAHVGEPVDMAVVPPPADAAAAALSAQIGFAGCPQVGGDGGAAGCTGAAPLTLTLVPLTSPGVTGYLWTIPDGAVPASSTKSSPLVTFTMPGVYQVYLAVVDADNQSRATASALIEVLPAPTGAPCTVSQQCNAGDDCRCSSAAADGGSLCPTDLSDGFCTRACQGGGCGDGLECVDLSLSASADPDAAAQPFRHPVCLPGCVDSSTCLGGFHCRLVPALLDGQGAGGAIAWRPACFADLLWSEGHACIGGDGRAAPASCLGGECIEIGARNLCSSSCADAVNHPCAPGSACATFQFDKAHPVCLPRCDKANPCADPLLDCAAPRDDGWLGFTVDDKVPTTYCAPRRCALDKDCAMAGHCTDPRPLPDAGLPDGGAADGGSPDGGVQFCVR